MVMNNQIQTVVLVLKSGGDFSFKDVELLSFHLHKQWHEENELRVLCLWDKIDQPFELINVTLLPTTNKEWPGWWTKMNLFAPDMEQYRPFLYMDLDTAVVNDLAGILPPTGHEKEFICLGGFFRPDTTHGLQSGLMWFPAKNDMISKVWYQWVQNPMGYAKSFQNRGGDQGFLRSILGSGNIFWQKITNKICSFKIGVEGKRLLTEILNHTSIVCFHGKPRIFEAAKTFDWVAKYVLQEEPPRKKARVTVIIPYKVDRGWLQDAINSVPPDVQLLISQGEGNWPQNFNKVLDQVEGEFIKYLHSDDILTENCIEDSVKAIEEQGVDFIHGKSINFSMADDTEMVFEPLMKVFGFEDLVGSNFIHSGTTMYRREIFEKIGGFDETLSHCEEYEFNLRCLQAGFKIGYCDSILCKYRQHPAQKSQIYANQVELIGKGLQEKYKKGGIQEAWVINLDKRKDRLEEFQKQLFPFKVEKFTALIRKTGEMGCKASHLTVLKKEHKFPFIVFEDDCQMIQHWNIVYNALLQLPTDWDMLYLGANLQEPLERYSENLYRLHGAWCAHAIIYNSQKVVDFIIENKNIKPALDDLCKTTVGYKFNCFITYPMVAVQQADHSDIVPGFRNYQNLLFDNYKKYTQEK